MKILRTLITYGFFPLIFFSGLGVAFLLIDQDIDHSLILAYCVLPAGASVLVMERLHPEYPVWNQSRGDMVTDLAHSIISQMLIPQLIQLTLLASLLTLVQNLPSSLGFSLWPNSYPLILQFIFAMLVSQFFEYWAHRLAHSNPILWRLHATHHSSERLYWLNAGRFHPLDTAISYIVSMVPLILMGAPSKVMLLFLVWVGIHGIFQHCNIRLRLGPLNYIFSMAELHRWHHSRTLEESNNNYGNNIILWDLVFGTWYLPKDRSPPIDVGLTGDELQFPKRYWGQVLSPFQWKSLHKSQQKSDVEER